MFYNRSSEPPVDRPIEHRDLQVMAGRIVDIETRHVGESLWLAIGRVSESIPTRRRLETPIEITETGRTEDEAVFNLRSRVALLTRGMPG